MSLIARTVHQFCPNNTIFFRQGGLQPPRPVRWWARVISWYSRWWRLSCGFLRGLEYLSRRCPLLWHLKQKPNFSYNYHPLLTVDSSRFHTMSVHVFLSSQNITWVFACSFSWATSIYLNLTWVSLVQDSLNYWSNQRLSVWLDSRFQPLIYVAKVNLFGL